MEAGRRERPKGYEDDGNYADGNRGRGGGVQLPDAVRTQCDGDEPVWIAPLWHMLFHVADAA